MAKSDTLGCISKSKYDVIVSRIKGEFKVPVNQRTKNQINALNLIRKRKDFSISTEGCLLCNRKVVIVEEELPQYVRSTFRMNNGCGPRVLYNKLKERYTGFSEKRITEILHRSSYFHKQYPRFTNKPLPRTVTSSACNQRWQIDILNMKGFEVIYEKSIYKYILQVIDIYSRYIMPQPLKSKSSAEVAAALEMAMLDHGFPEAIQCDNGPEFQGSSMKSLLEKHNIRIIHGRPYHPQSQGKCEHSNLSLRRKIVFACRRKKGFNWVSDLKYIAHSINTSVKRVLGNMTPFQVYHGRSHAGDLKSLSRSEIKQRLATANKSFRRRQLRGAKIPSKYKVGERILLRYPFTKSRVPTKRHILCGIIEAVKPSGRYLVRFYSPKYNNKVTVQEWVSVDNITSLTRETEKQRQRKVDEQFRRNKERTQKKLHRTRYYQVLNHVDKIQMLNTEFQNGIEVLMNPEPNGNCQFTAIKHQLQLHGIYRDESSLRKEAVNHLNKNRCFYENFVYGSSFCDYLKQMTQNGSYGDNLTLMAIMREYNMQCLVLSTAGAEHSTLVSNDGNYDRNLPLITLGYFPENEGMHYVSVSAEVNLVLTLLEDTVCPTPESESMESEPNPGSTPQRSPGLGLHSGSESEQSPGSTPPPHSPGLGLHSGSEPELCPGTMSPHSPGLGLPSDSEPIQYPEFGSTSGSKQGQRLGSGPSSAVESFQTQRATLIKMRQQTKEMNKNRFQFKLLPLLVQEMIVSKIIDQNPAMRFVLEKVDQHFVDLFKSMKILRPRIYISPALFDNVPNPVSVRYLLIHLGRNSGVIQEIKRIIKESCWANAWLMLRISGFQWYDIVDIFFSRRYR